MHFTDSHCHLDFPELTNSLPLLLSQCASHKINRIIVPAVYPEHWLRVLSLRNTEAQSTINKNNHVNIACALGIHPWFLISHSTANQASQQLDQHQKRLTDLVNEQRGNIVAIGECGIDVFKAKKNTGSEQALQNNLISQQSLFDMQLNIAKDNCLPVIVHHCQSHQYILPLLKQFSLKKTGVIHAFSGSYQQAKAYVDLGFKLGIGGTITYPRAKKTINAIKKLPLDCLLLETDAPAMPPFGNQGEVNTPLNIIEIFHALTEIRTESAEEIANQLEENNNQLFFS